MKKSILALLAVGTLFTACNQDVDFPEYTYQTIYFARQTPVRTITLGDDGDYNTDLDNAHCFELKATLGGINENRQDRSVEFVVDPSLAAGITYADGSEVKVLPADYYQIASTSISIPKGQVLGGVKVQLTDKFFADPASVSTTYVLPVRLTNGSDSILCGQVKDGLTNPYRLNSSDWAVLPKDYVLYAVKYKNPYHGVWLSKGTDVVTYDGKTTTTERKPEFWEKATLRELSSKSLTKSVYKFVHNVPVIDADGNASEKALVCDLIIDIDAAGKATVTTDSPDCTAAGQGTWVRKGEPKAWGDKDRDQLKLKYDYTITYTLNAATGEKATYKVSTDETLVMRDRQNKLEDFSYVLK